MHPLLQQIFSCTLQGNPVPPHQIAMLPDLLPEVLLDLMALASLQRSRSSRKSFTCGIINAKSGNCTENCSFCAQSRHHATQAEIYPRVSVDTLLKRAEELSKAEATFMGIVISGRSPSPRDIDYFCRAAEAITERVEIKLCASFGILTFKQALALRQAGFSSCHHNLETSRSFYPSICTTHAYELRLDTVRNAQKTGLRVCSGGIFGLGESWEQRIELAMTLKELSVDSIPINFLTTIPGTPLEKSPPLSPQESLAIIAIMRLVNPDPDIIVCGGRKSILGAWENFIFSAGANSLMTGNYLTTSGGEMESDRAMMRLLGVSS